MALISVETSISSRPSLKYGIKVCHSSLAEFMVVRTLFRTEGYLPGAIMASISRSSSVGSNFVTTL